MIDCLRSFCLVKSRGFVHLAALGLVSMMHYVTVKTVVLEGRTGMHKTGCIGEQDLSCMYLAHHELESVEIIIDIFVIIIVIIVIILVSDAYMRCIKTNRATGVKTL